MKTSQLNNFHHLQKNPTKLQCVKNTLSGWSKSRRNMQIQSSYKVHLNTISNGELSDPLCDSINKGLTLVRLLFLYLPLLPIFQNKIWTFLPYLVLCDDVDGVNLL